MEYELKHMGSFIRDLPFLRTQFSIYLQLEATRSSSIRAQKSCKTMG